MVKEKDRTSDKINSKHPIRRLLIFQLKLALDALRDLVLSPVAIVATLIDLIEKRQGKQSYFDLVLKYGRESERRINLFDQEKSWSNRKTLDSVVSQVEEVILKEYHEGAISEKTRKALKQALSRRSKTEATESEKTQ